VTSYRWRGTPLGVYVHWPYCAKICPYCDFNVVRDRGRTDEQAALADAIVADLRAQRDLTGPRRLLSIFFGGGTPSLMDPAQVARVIETAKALWTPADDLEISLEANPTDAETDRFDALAAAGVARLSLGVQALNDEALALLGRNHDAGSARRAIAVAAKAFPRLSADLIYATPGQTVEAWARELDELLAYGPEHVSPYQLTIEARHRLRPRGRPGQAGRARRGPGRRPVRDHPSGAGGRRLRRLRGVQPRPGRGSPLAPQPRLLARPRLCRRRSRRPRPPDAPRRQAGHHGPAQDRRLRPRGRETGVGFEREALTALEAAEERLLLGLRIDDGVTFAEIAALGLSPDTPKVKSLVERASWPTIRCACAPRDPAVWCWTG
jgi:coproporphyrinogen III oxidase-like Fe-S oxidoreductase